MQELVWLLEPIRVWLNGGTAEEVFATDRFQAVALLCAVLVPGTLIAMLAFGDDWRRTPLAAYLGMGRDSEDACWPEPPPDAD